MRIIKLLSIALALSTVIFVMACGGSDNANQTANNANNSQTANANTKAQATPTPDAMASARTAFAAECARCHGDKGDGGTVTVLKKKLNVPSLKKGHALNHTDEQLAKIIREGEEAMPAFKDKFKPEEITNLVQLIRKEFQAGAAKK